MSSILSSTIRRSSSMSSVHRASVTLQSAVCVGGVARQYHASTPMLGKFRKNRRHKGVLSPKHQPRDWYKGVGARRMGRHTRKGGYIIDPARVPQYVVPPIAEDFPLKPYVNKNTPMVKVGPPNYEALLAEMIRLHESGEALSHVDDGYGGPERQGKNE